jgi:lysine-specific demethylase 3
MSESLAVSLPPTFSGHCANRGILDTCMTSLFSTSFMCRHCGREVCNECFQIVKELYHPQKECTPEELPVLLKAREKHALMNPFFLSCLKRNDHEFKDFVPVTRFIKAELDKAIEEMQGILDREAARMTVGGQTQNEPLTYTDFVKDPNAPFPDPIITPVLDDFTPSNVRTHVTSIPTYHAQIIPASLYDPASPNSAPNSSSMSFASLWERGVPLLVKDVLPRFNMPWNPDFFMETYGDESCLIVECQTDENKRVSVREFFGWFGKYEKRTNCWKLKVSFNSCCRETD